MEIINNTAPRIISLVPSTTKTICDLGFQDNIVGYTHFCIDPPNLHRNKTCIGGTKDPDIQKITQLRPDIVFINQEENTKTTFDELTARLPHTYLHLSQPKTIQESISDIQNIEQLLQVKSKNIWSQKLNDRFQNLKLKTNSKAKTPALYFIWKEPYMVAGKDTYINDTMKYLGFKNICKEQRYPLFNKTHLEEKPYILLSNEPYPFRKRDAEEFYQKYKTPKEFIHKIDGQLMSWHGTTISHFLNRALRKPFEITQPIF